MFAGDNLYKGFVSAVVGFVIAILVPVFFEIYGALNAPWWTYATLKEAILVITCTGNDLHINKAS